MHMHANKTDNEKIRREIANIKAVKKCAERHGAVGDFSSMKICYLLRRHPNLSVSEIAGLVGLSVSATSRCLTKLKVADVVTSTKVTQAVQYQLQDNDFTKQLIMELER